MEESEQQKLIGLVLDFFEILDKEEMSDSGRKFHPTSITSCRCMDVEKLGKILPEMKEICERNKK